MGSAQANFAFAETYDPLILAKWGTYRTRGDASKAQDLYARADAAGIKETKALLERCVTNFGVIDYRFQRNGLHRQRASLAVSSQI